MNLEFNNIGGATCVLRIDSIIKIGIDPILSPKGSKYNFKLFTSERIKDPVYEEETFKNINIWLLTHNHEDHIDKHGLEVIDDNALVIINKNCTELLKDKKTKVLVWDEIHCANILGYEIKITSIPAYHGNNFIMRNIVGKVNGYFIEIKNKGDKKTIYFTSDTVYHNDVVKKVNEEVDLMVVNMGEVMNGKFGGPLTMTVSMLKEIEAEIKPKLTYPIHINDFSHYKTEEKELLDNGYNVIKTGKWITVV